MTDFLVRKFIHHYAETTDPKVRTSYGVLGSVVGIICNIFLFVVKCSVGLLSGSVSVLADAFNNLSDMASSVISLAGIRMSDKPADKEHPFGHGRVEYIVSLIVSCVIINVGITFLQEAVKKIRNPQTMEINLVTLILLLVSVAVKLWMAAFNRNLGARIHSDILKATSTDSLFDAITTSVTILSLVIYRVFAVNIDGIASLIVAAVIIWVGISLAKETLTPLIGEKMDPEMEKRVVDLVSEDPSVLSTHDLIIHNYGQSHNMATIHIEVSDKMTLEEAHTVADVAEKRVLRELGIALVVHVDPVNLDDAGAVQIREQLKRILSILDPDLTFHDLQVTHEGSENRISFDIEVPYSYKPADEDRILKQVPALMQEMDPANHCVITLDRGVLEEKTEG